MEQSILSDNIPHLRPISDNADVSGYESTVQKTAENLNALNLLVEGVHCAACIQKIESALARQPDIRYVRLNFSTRRLTIHWEGDVSNANQYAKLVTSLGYKIEPYNPTRERASAEAEEKFLLLCLGVAGFAMGNIMLLSVGLWSTTASTMGMETRDFMHLVSGLIAIPAMLFSGRPFFRSAFAALSKGHTNMDVPITVGVFLTGGMSLFEAYHHAEHAFFDSGVMLLFFLLIGRYLDFRARQNARSTATNLLSTFTGFATVLDGATTRRILIRDIREDMVVMVAAGEKFPVDGTVMSGTSDVDTSLVTGETVPRPISQGENVFAGTLNLSAPVTIQVAKAAENSLLADIVRLMEKAGQGQSYYVRLADRAARLYTPVVHTLAIIAFFAWWLGVGVGWVEALMIATTVLIITCPCAMGLAVPVVQVLATSRLMKAGILVKSGDALERLASIDTILMDKTGTITRGKPTLVDIPAETQNFVIAASLARYSHHPLAKALRAAYHGEDATLEAPREVAGHGMEAIMDGSLVRLGSRAWCGDVHAPAHAQMELWCRIGNNPPVPYHFDDQIKSDAKDVVAAFRAMGMKIIILSGDRNEVVTHVANDLGVTEFFAQKSPTEKFSILEKYKLEGRHILMIGDGLNDAPVLAGAHVSMAPGSAIDMAQNAADIVFMGDDNLAPVLTGYRASVLAQKLVKENFILAIIYNMVAIPLALFGYVTPMIAALAMSGSSLVVIANSFRLRLLK